MTEEESRLLDKYFDEPAYNLNEFSMVVDCKICKSIIYYDNMLTHAEWHEGIQELIDWAQRVSEKIT